MIIITYVHKQTKCKLYAFTILHCIYHCNIINFMDALLLKQVDILMRI